MDGVVRHHVQSDRKAATLKEDTTYEAIKIELAQVVDIVLMLWRVVDAALSKQGPDRQEWRSNGVAVLKAIYPGPGSLTKMLDTDFGKDLDPIRRKKFTRVIESLKWLSQMIEQREESPLWLENIRTMLSHFEKYMEDFDSEGAQKLKSRKRTKVDHRAFAAHMEPTVNQFERTGNLQP